MTMLKLAWRNLWRHRTRTVIMGSAVALTYAMGLVAMSIGDDGHQRMLKEALKASGGDVLVHHKGYWDSRASDAVIPHGDSILAEVARVPGVKAAIPRVLAQVLVSTSAGTRGGLLMGVDSAREAVLRDPAEDLEQGTFLDSTIADPIVLGARMAERLKLAVGDRVVITGTQPNGDVTRALFHLAGTIRSGTRELDESVAYTTVAAARQALHMDGALTQIGVVSDGVDGETLAARLRDSLGAATHDLEVLSWRQAVPEMVGYIQLDDAFGYVYIAVILLVVLFSIANTFLMAVMERVRELGLLSALGMSGRRIGNLLIWETVLLTGLAMTVGFAIGLGAHLAVDHWGINVASYGVKDMEVSGINMADMVIHSSINPMKWFVATLLVAGATIASALYPALRASRLAPSEAMRFYE